MKKIIFIILLIGIFSFYLITNNNQLSNDYYNTINEEFLSHNYLKKDKYIYNTFTKAQEESNTVRNNIISDIVNNNIKLENGINDKIKTLYNNVLDTETRNNLSLGPLKDYIDKINNSKNINELINNTSIIEKDLGIDIFTNIVVDKDFLNNKKNIVYLYPVTFAFGASADYFIDEDYMAYKAYIKKAIIDLLEKYGFTKNEARLISTEVISFYTTISENSKLSSDYTDVRNYYNIIDNEQLSNIYSNLDIVNYLKNKGINQNEYSIVDELQYQKINEYLKDEYLIILKKTILVKILSTYASYIDMEYRDIVINLNNNLTGTTEDNNIQEDATNIISGVFSNDIDKVYESKVITDKDKEYLNLLFNDIKKQFKKMLENNTWLSNETKEKALIKLDKMKVYIGNYDETSNSEYLNLDKDNLISNIISINKSNFSKSLERLDTNKEIKTLSESEVNAYYSPMTNAVYIPSSVMFLYSSEDNYYEKLGTIGMVIAHEVTHGFDYNGSMFDSDGNLNNWWNDTDRANYKKLKKNVINYYNEIEVLKGKYINGEKTVNENIADIGALKVITKVALNNNATNNDLKQMYSSFATFWQSQATEEYSRLLLLNDSHSPNKYRVNAVLSSIDEFYEVYNIYPWNDMYISDNNRINIW